MSDDTEYEYVHGNVTRATQKAVLLSVEDLNGTREIWIPRSCIQDGEEVSVFDEGLYVAEWFCEKEGL